MVTEVMSLGSLSLGYKGLEHEDKRAISDKFELHHRIPAVGYTHSPIFELTVHITAVCGTENSPYALSLWEKVNGTFLFLLTMKEYFTFS